MVLKYKPGLSSVLLTLAYKKYIYLFHNSKCRFSNGNILELLLLELCLNKIEVTIKSSNRITQFLIFLLKTNVDHKGLFINIFILQHSKV